MCRIITTHHTCNHTLKPPPLQCPIYYNYYSESSLLDMASALLPTEYDCPWVQSHEYHTRAKCNLCLSGFNSDTESDAESDASSIHSKISGCSSATTISRSSSTSSNSTITSKYSNKASLELLEANMLLAPKLIPNQPARYEGLEKVYEWEGWTRLNARQKKTLKGGFGGVKVKRKVVRSSISDLD